ncbi:uncharacterized protein LOC129745380 [Uranotaenia lowii]|uniref:uncharacterized protein LOC129745380 n=1 Tax=Uranotaenia lowii TaxID=190385 RepID=UPI0024787262|nr:uncharacterized protein LOC129745380 [Uranotaenia lowii]XP_055594410.1 uncharacterized protein LOC129745380 [Uranotaenia lowii]XP_055594412.1 uncharacterized protein LOC129745380 [Uranotaenia lowii]
MATCNSCDSIRASSAVRKAKLDSELKRLEEEKEIEMAYLTKRYQTLKKSLMQEEDEICRAYSCPKAVPAPAEKVRYTTEYAISCWEVKDTASQETSTKVQFSKQGKNAGFPKRGKQHVGFPKKGNPNAGAIKECQQVGIKQPRDRPHHSKPQGLTPEQLAARQIFPLDLPTFSGNPAHWPDFISAYRNSTEACGFSNFENMIRLQQYLKNQAAQVVRSRLINPDSVPQAIETLRSYFGKPMMIIEDLLEKIRLTPSPNLKNLDSVMMFGSTVHCVCARLKAADLNDYLDSPDLLYDLLDKLPYELEMQWDDYIERIHSVNLQTLGSFIDMIGASFIPESSIAF